MALPPKHSAFEGHGLQIVSCVENENSPYLHF